MSSAMAMQPDESAISVGWEAVLQTRRAIGLFVAETSEPDASGEQSRARLRFAESELANGITGLVAASVDLEPAILAEVPSAHVTAMQARLDRARRERDGDFLLPLIASVIASLADGQRKGARLAAKGAEPDASTLNRHTSYATQRP